ncbi:putative pectinesterase 52 [Cucurbita pepo subsp. pepo]|uniref:putative pectinesterase 52 n=1 Tax=Cucurbita pepo subsp. pepo TaxID=3664 RepID=UPI000C9D4C5E|nr:putative pectinesterase 52 [Cucurbita pepo subsp. pepo]
MVRGISFKNTYNAPGSVTSRNDIKPALAAFVDGDKAVFHQCGFYGLQDTLWDGPGRHRYTECYIEGVIDVISGTGQSIYEKCVINIPINVYAPILGHGYITAQGKEASSHTNGFVFIECSVIGSGTVYLGRAYRRFSTVIYHKSFLSSCVNPVGWHPWTQVGHEMDFTYVESGCTGPGADISKRVPWIKNLNKYDLRRFIDISFIDQDGWTRKLPQF